MHWLLLFAPLLVAQAPADAESWRQVQRAPVVEPVPARPGFYRVTFLYRAPETARIRLDSGAVAAVGNGLGKSLDVLSELKPTPGTGVHTLSLELPANLRIGYRFEIAGVRDPVLDPLNPHVYMKETRFAESLLELPEAPAQPWRERKPAGRWEKHEAPSMALGRPQTIWVYTPAGYMPTGPRHAAIVAMDSVSFGQVLPADRVLDLLIEQGRLRPAILVATPDLAAAREQESYEPAVQFLARELMPWVRSKYRVSERAEDVVIAGISRRGMVAAYAAFRRPEVFGGVLALSGAFYWKPPGTAEFEWLASLVASEPRRRVRFYLGAGTLETILTSTNAGHYPLSTSRHLRNVLRAKGYPVTLTEFPGAHSPVNWQDQLAAGFEALLPRRGR
ncbi:MAG: DUF3327 domain-containing protein [Bryobacteraceae bacterium]|nr:DUF3327 domain-containing protein [Bryobacteraceae bacterium]